MSTRSTKSSSSQIAALKRLSLRAAATYYTHSHSCSSHPHHHTTTTTTTTNSSRSSSNSNNNNKWLMSIIDELRQKGIPMEEGLSEEQLCRVEASLDFTFPPDLRALLHEVLPVGLGFVDWRSISLDQLHLLFALPSMEVARSHAHFWMPKHWGVKPSNHHLALSIARNALNKAPLLIPLFSHYYLPSTPNLFGNPIFFISPSQFHLASFNLQHFFHKHHFKPQRDPFQSFVKPRRAREARHIQFWSDLAQSQHLHDFELSFESNHVLSLTSFPYHATTTEEERSTLPWLERLQSGLTATLREGGWEEEDIFEMMNAHLPPYTSLIPNPSKNHLYLDNQSMVEELALYLNLLSEFLKREGWSSKDVAEALDVAIPLKGKRKNKQDCIPPRVVAHMRKLAQDIIIT